MAPKTKKAIATDRAKAVEDKTFGLKNKKGAKQQKFVSQVLSSATNTASKGSGPSKKELKELQKKQEEEMMALFTIVPKKNADAPEAEPELDPDEGPTFTDITQEIEYQRANVVAKTKITNDVFKSWRAAKTAQREKDEAEAKADRRRKGLLTGREIFLEASSTIVDDDTAADESDVRRELDEDEEIRIMEQQYRENMRLAREEAGLPPEEEGTSAAPGQAAAVAPASTTLNLSAAEHADIFGDDDDDDEDLDAELENQKG